MLFGTAVIAATTLAGIQISSPLALPAAAALLLPGTTLCSAVGIAADVVCTRLFSAKPASRELQEGFVRLLILSLCGVIMLAAGGFAANVLMIQEPFARETIVG